MNHTNIIDELKHLEQLEAENEKLKKEIAKELKKPKQYSNELHIRTFKENPEYYALQFESKKEQFQYFKNETLKLMLNFGVLLIVLAAFAFIIAGII